MVLTKEFDPDLEELGKDFTSEENKDKRAAYKANYTKEQKQKVYDAWVLFMRDLSRNVPFFFKGFLPFVLVLPFGRLD